MIPFRYLCGMETIFDYNPTEKELINIYGRAITLDYYVKHRDRISAYRDLGLLFIIRNDRKKAEEYAEKLPIIMQESFWRTVCHMLD